MTIWLFIWFVLSATLLYFLVWNLIILMRQKKVWKAFAAAKTLRYSPGTLFGPAEVNGLVDGHTISLFTGEHLPPDGRNGRKMTAMEVNLSSRLPFGAGLASGGMVEIIKAFGMKDEVMPVDGPWEKSWVAVSTDPGGFEAYLTRERAEALAPLMKMKNGWVILVFQENVSLLRLDTSDPLDSPEKVEKLSARMIAVARVLELKDGEERTLKEAAARRPRREARIETGKKPIQALSLELEEDAAKTTPPPDDTTENP